MWRLRTCQRKYAAEHQSLFDTIVGYTHSAPRWVACPPSLGVRASLRVHSTDKQQRAMQVVSLRAMQLARTGDTTSTLAVLPHTSALYLLSAQPEQAHKVGEGVVRRMQIEPTQAQLREGRKCTIYHVLLILWLWRHHT